MGGIICRWSEPVCTAASTSTNISRGVSYVHPREYTDDSQDRMSVFAARVYLNVPIRVTNSKNIVCVLSPRLFGATSRCSRDEITNVTLCIYIILVLTFSRRFSFFDRFLFLISFLSSANSSLIRTVYG